MLTNALWRIIVNSNLFRLEKLLWYLVLKFVAMSDVYVWKANATICIENKDINSFL